MTPTEEIILHLFKDHYYKYGKVPSANDLIALYASVKGKTIARQAIYQHLDSLAKKDYLIKIPHKWILK